MVATIDGAKDGPQILRAARLKNIAVYTAMSLCTMLGTAAGEELRIIIPEPDTNAYVKAMKNYVSYIEENSDLEPKLFGKALMLAPDVPAGVRDGIANLGFVVPAYVPAEFSEMNLAANLSMLATSGEPTESPLAAMSGAMMEYVLFNCPECLDQFKAQNQIFLSSASTPTYSLLCRDPLSTLEDMKGKRFRSGAANFGRWAESVGGVAVSMPSSEMYDALSQGVVDCVMLDTGGLLGQRMMDVTKTVIRNIPGGVFAGIATNNVNQDYWRQLSNEQRATLINGSAGLVADVAMFQDTGVKESEEAAVKAGVTINEPIQELVDATNAFVEGDLNVISEQFAKQYGVENTDEKVAKVKELISKWKKLTDGHGSDYEALRAIYQKEIFDKLDPATYGMN